ncbi:MAG: hypothetical protein GTN81_00420 [Proteobacteria bacterium]|nr:hypothetical protein [Pseudomonadota bacterium]
MTILKFHVYLIVTAGGQRLVTEKTSQHNQLISLDFLFGRGELYFGPVAAPFLLLVFGAVMKKGYTFPSTDARTGVL